MTSAWSRSLLPPLVACLLPVLAFAEEKRRTHHIVVCNGYADTRSILVSEQLTLPSDAMLQSHHYRRAVAAANAQLVQTRLSPSKPGPPFGLQVLPLTHQSQRRKHRRRFRKLRGAQKFGDHAAETVWTRTLSFGMCEEYYIDLASRKISFTSPDRSSSCDFIPDDKLLEEAGEFGPPRIAAVLTQRSAASSACWVRTTVLPPVPAPPSGAPPALGAARTHPPPAEFVALDAFTPDGPPSVLDDALEEEDLSGNGDVEDPEGLPDLDRGAEIWLEDEVEPDVIATEIIATRTLGLNHVYMVEPKHFLVALEDLRGNDVLDKTSIKFESGRTYVGFRTGRAGDKDFPEKLMMYTCQVATPVAE
mmetsp:Transcript_120880/g.386101  ORF Transcript_120880/g.386101 Transcript_120880/m.386101 type:complete len:362 (+) Transcript_120880:152-1237(+)